MSTMTIQKKNDGQKHLTGIRYKTPIPQCPILFDTEVPVLHDRFSVRPTLQRVAEFNKRSMLPLIRLEVYRTPYAFILGPEFAYVLEGEPVLREIWVQYALAEFFTNLLDDLGPRCVQKKFRRQT